MTTRERGVCVVVPVVTAGLVAVWGGAVILMLAFIDFGSPTAAVVGIFLGIVAGSWTVGYMVRRHETMMRSVFELGREAGQAEVRSLADHR